MKISTKGRYALRMMIDLASQDTGGYTSIKSIAERQDISGKYLEQITILLSRAGLVKSARGARGGYSLAIPARDITVGMILRSIEGSLAPVYCIEGSSEVCPRRSGCAALDVWKRIDEAVSSVVDNTTLESLAQKQQAKS